MSEEKQISKSKQKRLDRKKEVKDQKKKIFMEKFWAVTIPLLIILTVVGIYLYQKSLQLDYSKGLAKDGTVAGINIDEYCTTTYEQMSFSKADLVESEYTIESDIQTLIDEHATVVSDNSVSAQFGDKVSLAYTATCEGTEVEAYTEENGGKDYTVGTEEISAEFDTALADKVPGESWTITVLREDDYYDSEVAGKSVEYSVKLLGVYNTEEFDDAFVQKYLSDEASTAEEYRQILADNHYKENLKSAVTDSISNNCIIIKYPDNLIKNNEKIIKTNDENTMQMYASYGYTMENPWSMYGYESEEEYNIYVHDQAVEAVEDILYRNAIFKKAGLTNTEEEVKAYFTSIGVDEDSYNGYVKQYGYNYLANAAMMNKVVDYLVETVTVTE